MNKNYKLKAVMFDWGHTLMDENKDRDIPTATRPITLMPEVRDCLAQIELPMGLWANTESSESEIRTWLARANLTNYFSCVISSKDIGHSKPAKEFFSAALAQCGYQKNEVVFVGNQLSSDIRGANDFGIKSVWLAEDVHRSLYDKLQPRDVRPTYTVESLAEVPALVRQIAEQG